MMFDSNSVFFLAYMLNTSSTTIDIRQFNSNWRMSFRVLWAGVGGFAFASSVSIFLATLWLLTFGSQRADAVVSASALAFALWCAAIMWVFYVRRLKVVVIEFSAVSLLCLLGSFLLRWLMSVGL